MLKEPLQLEGFEISPRFRQTVEERVARLEKDADWDEAQIANLENIEHIRRQMRLVAAQRAEASRMRSFLDRSKTRVTQPVVAL
jgi:ribosome-associated translation inhibitor RaiA